MRTLSLTLLLCSLLLSCATRYSDQISFLDGDRYNRANIHTYPTRIDAIDGNSTFARENPVRIEPGDHVVRIVTAPTAGFSSAESHDLKLTIEPCKRYYIVASRENRLMQEWVPMVEQVVPQGGKGCPSQG